MQLTSLHVVLADTCIPCEFQFTFCGRVHSPMLRHVLGMHIRQYWAEISLIRVTSFVIYEMLVKPVFVWAIYVAM